jgi:high-affinity nickel-transport protein
MLGMAAVIVLLLGGGSALLLAAMSGESRADIPAFGLGTGLVAVSLGMRHAFDVDHISMIDNTSRALIGAGRRPLAVGFFFSLGHSSVVLVLTVLVGIGAKALGGAVLDDTSVLHRVAAVVGASVSGGFLYAIAVVNLVLLITVVRTARRSARGDRAPARDAIEIRGPLGRLFSRAGRGVDASWKIFPVGVLFGLGFDTATEVALLVVSAVATVGGLPLWAVLSLPLLFAGGMCLFDTLDGWLMSAAYGWASDVPMRRVRFNVAITALSVAVAFTVGTFELGGLVGHRFGWDAGFLSLDPGVLGLGVTALFAAVMVGALLAGRRAPRKERIRDAVLPVRS